MKIAGVPKDAIHLNLFSFSVAGEAKRWLYSFKGKNLWTWEKVVEKFLKKYFLESKTTEGKVEISSFHQFPEESLSEALDHFYGLLRKTPTHEFNELVQLNIFIDDLRPHSMQLLDASIGGKIKLKTPDESMELIENMATSDHAILRDQAYTPTKKSLLELTSQDALLAQKRRSDHAILHDRAYTPTKRHYKLIAKKIETLTETLNKLPQQFYAVQSAHSSVIQIGGCNICGGAHESGICIAQDDASKEDNYMAIPNCQRFYQGRPPEYNQGGNFSQVQGWRSHPRNNFNKDQGCPSIWPSNQGPNLYKRTTKLEETLTQIM